MERRQTVHKHRLASRLFHQLLIDLIRGQVLNSLGPDLGGFSHGDPDIGIENVCIQNGLHGVRHPFDCAAALRGQVLAGLCQHRIRKIGLRRAGHEVHSHFGTAHHQGIAHIIAGISQIYQFQSLQVAEMLLNGEEVRQNLGGVELIGETIPHGDSRILGQLLYNFLAIAPVLNAVKHPAQHSGRVRDALFLGNL